MFAPNNSMPKKPKGKKKYGFLDIMGTDKTRPMWLQIAEKRLRKGYGNPCRSMEPDCINCKMWHAWAMLNNQIVVSDRFDK